jgi:WD40 repeat protein
MSVLEPLQPETPWDELIARSRHRGTVLRRRRLAARGVPAALAALLIMAVPVRLAGDVDDRRRESHVTTVDLDGPATDTSGGSEDGSSAGRSGPVADDGTAPGGASQPSTGAPVVGTDATTGGRAPSGPDATSPSPTTTALRRSSTPTKVAFVRGDPLLLTGDLLVMRPDGTDVRRVTTASGRPSWSPDGSRLAFHRAQQDVPGGKIFTIAEDGTGEQLLHTGMFADWSPDGHTIAFSDGERYDGTTLMDLWLIGADGANARRLTDDPAGEYMPTWSPDGGRLVYLRIEGSYGATGSASLWTVRPDGSERRKLADIATSAVVTPTWSPDGTTVLYSCPTGLCAVAADGSTPPRDFPTPGTAFEYGVSWSADGLSIFLQRDADGSYVGAHNELWVLDRDGSTARRLTQPSSGDDLDPAVWPRYPVSG